MAQRVRQADIARELGVSVVTVSRALAGKEGVGEELGEKIRETAAAMGYAVRGEEAQESAGAVGILVAEHYLRPEHSFFLALHLHLTEALTGQGFTSLLEVIGPDRMDRPPALVAQGQADALVVVGKLPEPYLRLLEDAALPLVYLDFYGRSSRAVSVVADSYLGAWDMTRHLLARGHREIGYLGSIRADWNAQDRYFGFCKALMDEGITPRPQWVIPNRGAKGFLDDYTLPDELPTAFVCDCDQSAYHFLRFLTGAGLRVPEDISLTGFYDHVYSTMTTPQLTTYHIDMAELAARSADALAELMAGEHPPARILVGGHLVERDSVRQI